jgi:ferredoxin
MMADTKTSATAAAAAAAKEPVQESVKEATEPKVKLAELGLKGDGFAQTVAVVVDPSACPPTHVCMHIARNARVALTSGRVYIFEAGKPQFVNKEDRDAVAACGAGEYTAQ